MSRELSREDRIFLERLSRLATANPFLPERIELERQILEDAFEEGSPVWSKRLDRRNPNVLELEARATATANGIRARLGSGALGSDSDRRLYEELVFYILYYRFEEEFSRAMSEPSVRFYEPFCREAVSYLSTRIEPSLTHWFSFLFQIRRASHHIFDFIVGSSFPAAKLRAAIWQSIFTHDLRRYRRALFDRMGDVSTLVT
ncbi:MAG TPA: hypothetical protein VIG29_01095, partial [Vicinamibacteria bacterium]